MSTDLSREQAETLTGATVLEFGAGWCPHCIAARPLIERALAEHPGVRHLQIEDGRGKRLGRSYTVKLWPTFVFLRNGVEVARVVRPRSAGELADAFAKLQ